MTDRRYYAIYNENAGRSRADALARFRKFFPSRGLQAQFSTADGCNWDDVRKDIAEGQDVRFVVAGGDGTLRLVMERLWERDLLDKVTMAFVPLGSANIAALCLGLPRALPRALELAISGTPRAVDIGLINNRHVFFIAAIFGAVSEVTVNARRSLKQRFGGLAYLLSIDRLLRNDYRGSEFQLSYDDGAGDRQEISSHSMIVCNQLSFGRLKPARAVLADDKHLDFFTLHNTRFWGLVPALWDYFRGKADSRVLRHRPFERAVCKLQGFKGSVHLDGDKCVEIGDTVDFRVMPHMARIVC
ncbi:diacylglycerol/lipid kinase family protein [Tepidamorphus sp. 3E244]|uniref:diacylglycerol/lipid kinase family protein n=1 Tax=Tepidamorphus sp. 3E244 TaxID=3385498 RepID=UPI0038FCC5BA